MNNRCRACGAPILWIRTPKGKWLPVNYGPVQYRENPRGKDSVVDNWGQIIHCDLNFDGLPTGLARIPHWATCPKAAQFKRKV